MRHWLMKSEPDEVSIDDLVRGTGLHAPARLDWGLALMALTLPVNGVVGWYLVRTVEGCNYRVHCRGSSAETSGQLARG